MNFIHDLTLGGDFSQKSSFSFPNFLRRETIQSEETPPNEEVVYTGDAETRRMKKYIVDYETDKNICDCCGLPIDNIPWHFVLTKLCKPCETFLEYMKTPEAHENQNIIIGEDKKGFITKRQKPWDFEQKVDSLYDTDRFEDNVLLWD